MSTLSPAPARIPAWRSWPADGRSLAAGLAGLAVLVVTVTVATALGYLPLLAAGAAAAAVAVISFRWPLLPLFAYAALVPIDEIVRLGPLGSVGRTAAILFVVAYAAPRLTRIRWSVFPLAAWAYLGWAVASILWALDQNVAIAELGTLVQLFAMGLLTADVVRNGPSIVRPLLWAYALSATVTALIGIRGFLEGTAVDGQRVAALPGQDPAQYAAILLPALVFGAHELLRRRLVPLSMLVTASTATAILLSGTRGAWVSMGVVAAVFVLPRLAGRTRIIAAAAAALVLLGVLQIPGVADFVTSRANLAVSTGGSGRTTIWAVGLDIFGSSPIVGVGFANFPIAFTPTQVEAAFVSADPGVGRAPHNLVIGTLGELGIVGLVLLVLFLAPLVLRAGRGPEGVVVQAMLASLLTAALFLDVLSNRKQVWLVIGIAAGLAYLRDRVPGVTAETDVMAGADVARQADDVVGGGRASRVSP